IGDLPPDDFFGLEAEAPGVASVDELEAPLGVAAGDEYRGVVHHQLQLGLALLQRLLGPPPFDDFLLQLLLPAVGFLSAGLGPLLGRTHTGPEADDDEARTEVG